MNTFAAVLNKSAAVISREAESWGDFFGEFSGPRGVSESKATRAVYLYEVYPEGRLVRKPWPSLLLISPLLSYSF